MRPVFPSLAILTIIAAVALSVRAEGGPDDSAVTQVWDFGYLSQKAEVSHTFYLANHSETPLTVTKIKPGCSCTSTSELKDPIPPHDSAAIEVTFKSGRYKGGVTKTTKIFTDDEKNEAFRLAITANVVKKLDKLEPISVSPAKLKATVRDGQIGLSTEAVSLANGGESEVTVSLIATSAGLELAGLPVTLPAGEQTAHALSLDPSRIEDVDWIAATLELTAANTTRVTIPIEIER